MSCRTLASRRHALPRLSIAVLFLVILACAQPPSSTTTPEPLTKTPRVTPTTEPTPDVQATVEAMVQATVEARPTHSLSSVPPTPTHTPIPTTTPVPTLTPTPTFTPWPTRTPTPTPTTTVLPNNFSLASAMLKEEDFPQGTKLTGMKWYTPDDLNPANPADAIAKTWGFLRSHRVEYVKYTSYSYSVYLATAAFFDSVEGAQKAVYDRKQYLEILFSERSDTDISEVLSSKIGDQAKAFKVQIGSTNIEQAAHTVVFNRNNVLGVIWVETVGSTLDMSEAPALAAMLNSLISQEMRSSSGPTVFRMPTPTPLVLPIPTPAPKTPYISSVLGKTASIDLEGPLRSKLLIDLPTGWTLVEDPNSKGPTFRWLDVAAITFVPTELQSGEATVTEIVKSMARSQANDDPNVRTTVGMLNGMTYSDITQWLDGGMLRRTIFIAIGDVVLAVAGQVHRNAVDPLWPSVNAAMNSVRPVVPTPTNTPTPILVSTPIPTPMLGTVHSVVDIVEKARAGVVRITGTTGSGSGFVVDSTGYILTNEHVIRNNLGLTAVFADGSRLTPDIVSVDEELDVALLRISSARSLTALPFASSVRVGEEVVALGYPLHDHAELQGRVTVTKGIVSSFRRIGDVAYVQTDAALNRGNSGGPLLNLRGEVVGMVTTGLPKDIAEGITFAVRHDTLTEYLSAPTATHMATPIPNITANRDYADWYLRRLSEALRVENAVTRLIQEADDSNQLPSDNWLQKLRDQVVSPTGTLAAALQPGAVSGGTSRSIIQAGDQYSLAYDLLDDWLGNQDRYSEEMVKVLERGLTALRKGFDLLVDADLSRD